MTFLIPAVFGSNGYSGEQCNEPQSDVREEPHIFVIRHAQSQGNVTGQYSTHPANPSYIPVSLTNRGYEQAEALGIELKELGIEGKKIAHIVSSPLPRALETAKSVAKQVGFPLDKILLDERLMERNLGARDGYPYKDFSGDHWYPDDPESFHGETSGQVQVRMKAAWEEAVSLSEGGDVLIISHGQPIHSLTETLTGNGQRIGNARYVEFLRDGSPVIK